MSGVPPAPKTDVTGLAPGVPCVRCGYDLAGLAMDGRCPECGEPVGASVSALTDGPPPLPFALKLARATLLLLAAVFFMATLSFRVPPLRPRVRDPATIVGLCGVAVGLFAALDGRGRPFWRVYAGLTVILAVMLAAWVLG